MSTPSLSELAVQNFHPSIQESLHDIQDIDTIKTAIIRESHYSANHLKGRVNFTTNHDSANRVLTTQEKANIMTNKLTGIANWTLQSEEDGESSILLRMDSSNILSFWIEILFTKQQFEKARKGKLVQNLKVKGRVADSQNKLVAFADNNRLRIDDELNLMVWIETDIPKEVPSENGTWNDELETKLSQLQ